MSSSRELAAVAPSGFRWRRGTIGPIAFGLAALACLFLLDRVGAAVLSALLLQSDDRMARIYAGGRHDDVLVLGGSVGNAMVLPPALSAVSGRSVFTMAVHGLDAVTQEALVKDYLELNAAPRVALMDIRTARATFVRAPEFRLYEDNGNAIAALNARQSESLIPWPDVFHLHRLNSPLLPLTIQRLIDRDDQATGASDGTISRPIIAAWRRSAISGAVRPDQIKAFAATVEAFRAAGTLPILVMSPLHPEARFQARDTVAEVSALLPGDVPLCDFSRLLDDDMYFEDPAHLNEAGRQAFLPILAALVTESAKGLPVRPNGPQGSAAGDAQDQIARACSLSPAPDGT